MTEPGGAENPAADFSEAEFYYRQKDLEVLRNQHRSYKLLRDSSSDICTVRYHYYCHESESKVPDDFTVVCDVRKVPIFDDDLPTEEKQNSALQKHIIKDGMGQLRLRQGANAEKALANWQRQFLANLQVAQEQAPSRLFYAAPEFGFPFGLGVQPGPEVSDAEFLVNETFHNAFICLGSAHREWIEVNEGGAEPSKCANIALVYPEGSDFVQTDRNRPQQVFRAKKTMLAQTNDLVHRLTTIPTHPRPKTGAAQDISRSHGLTVEFVVEGATVSADSAWWLKKEMSRNHPGQLADQVHNLAKSALEYYAQFDSRDRSDVASPTQYVFKQRPAKKIGEYIDAHEMDHIDVFVTSNGVVSVLICYDAFDPAIFMTAARMAEEHRQKNGFFLHPKVDIWFVPSYNHSKKLLDVCRQLSIETDSVVVYLNGAYSAAEAGAKPRFKIYASGYEAEDAGNLLGADAEQHCRPLSFENVDLLGFAVGREFREAARGGRRLHQPHSAQSENPEFVMDF